MVVTAVHDEGARVAVAPARSVEPPELSAGQSPAGKPANSELQITRSALIAVVVTCLVAAVNYAGAVTQGALFGFVLPATLIGAGVAAWQAQHGATRLAVGFGVPVALAWSEIANVSTGQGNGPAARASAVVGVCAVLSVVLVAGRAPALFLAPVAGMVLGAMLLGAGGEVRVVALATVAAGVVALAVVESSRRRWVPRSPNHQRPREASVVVLALLVVAVAVAVVFLQARVDHRAPHAAVRGSSNSMVHPAFGDPLPAQVGTSTGRATPVRPPPTKAKHSLHHGHSTTKVTHPLHKHRTRSKLIPLIIAAVILLLQCALLTRRIIAVRAWRATRRRLQGDSPKAAVAGAWIWAGIRLTACRSPLPPATSPDVAARQKVADIDRTGTALPLRELGELATPAAFSVSHEVAEDVATAAWHLADEVGARVEAALPLHRRIRLGFALPPAAHSRVG